MIFPHEHTRPAHRRPRAPALLVALLALLVLPGPAIARSTDAEAPVPQTLLDEIKANPDRTFSVIVEGSTSERSDTFAGRLTRELERDHASAAVPERPFAGKVRSTFTSVNGFAAGLSGRDVLRLRKKAGVLAIVPDATVSLDAANPQKWPSAIADDWFLSSAHGMGTRAATIAFVDSGIEGASGNLSTRILKQVDLGGGAASGDPRGHGTFVAGVAAGNGSYRGVAPDARLVSLDVFDSQGQGKTSDVIRAADWILKNRNVYGIRVANFSLQTSQPSSFLFDPLDRAVERLWQAGVVVVAAAGNYATEGQPSGVLFAPGNDPFVITVGANDVNGSTTPFDDWNAPWSSYGYTPDGFAKPELSAPGRYMIEQVSPRATLLATFPANVLDPLRGLIQLSGTSFSTAAVSGAAANLLGVHPEWTPDQVKGALMLSAIPLASAAPGSAGVGEINLFRAVSTGVLGLSNPNAALEQFLVPDPAGGTIPVFDAARWVAVASANPSWNLASWSSASWSSAAWSSASWSSASWSSASWSSASWSSASWSSASWSSASWSNGAGADARGDG